MTEKQKLLWDMWTSGAAAKDIAAALGISIGAVYVLRNQYDLPSRHRNRAEPEEPTPKQIAAAALKIQSRWTEEERERRSVGRAVAYEVPLVRRKI